MSYLSRALVVVTLAAAVPAFGVYAPIPEQEQGKDFTFSLRAGLAHDSNLFGAAGNEVGSAVWTIAPRAAYNASLRNQTFFSASYGLTLDQFDNRPGDKLLDSHEAALRLAHAFSKATKLDVRNVFSIARNPESLLSGVRVNTDQSFTRNQFDARAVTPLSAKISGTAKFRSILLEYRDTPLGRSLDRVENLYGLAADYAVLPEVKAVVEYRHQDVFYTKLGELKNKRSDYVMSGVDYELARKLAVSGRLGAEWRSRRNERDTTSPYFEFSAKYDYTERSFLAGGVVYTIEETSDTARFNDTKLYRGFVSIQHAVTAMIVASGSLTYEPAKLQGRRGQVDLDERTVRGGAAVSYLPTRNWSVSANVDYDRVRSDDRVRSLSRTRIGLSASYTF
jgi:predicted porin